MHGRSQVIIVLPTFNGEQVLPNMVEALVRAVEGRAFRYEILVVNDASADATGRIARELATRMPITVIDHERHLGLAESIRTGLLHAATRAEEDDVIVSVDGANVYSPMLVAPMLGTVGEGSDVVIASRYRPGAVVEDVPAYRRTLANVANLGFRLLYPTCNVRDFTSGYRAYRGKVLKAVVAEHRPRFETQSGFAFMIDILLTMRRMGIVMAEVPLRLRYEPRPAVSKKTVARALAATLRLMALANLDRAWVSDYFARPDTIERWWHPESGPLAFHYNAELTILDDHFPIDRCLQVLDVGTGRGRVGTYFARRGCKVVGIDPNEGMLAAARQAARRAGAEDRFEVQPGTAEDLSGFAAASFDVVLCVELFDHLPDLRRALQEIHRVLKPEGHLVFTYVPTESLYGAMGNVYRWYQTRRHGAQALISRTYRFAEIRGYLADSGFRLERYWGIGILCANAQTRLFDNNALMRMLTRIARAEAARFPYYEAPFLARHGGHVLALASRV